MMINKTRGTSHQTQIMETLGNTLVLASAGTGKTHLIIEKLMQLIKNNNGFKKLAAITYTDKAANEIKERLENKDTGGRVVSQTLHKWIMHEIIKPFVNNVYDVPSELPIKFIFNTEVNSFKEGISHLEKEGEIRVYKQNYEDRGRDFAFQLALEVLKESYSARRYLKATYCWIFVDEYQDVNKDQHALVKFMVEKLKIKAFIVGDNKQQIYSFRGSNTKFLESFMTDKSFTRLELTHNFRSNKEIVAYSRLFDDTYLLPSGYSQFNEDGVINVDPQKESIKEIVNKIKMEKPSESILILKTKNKSIEQLKKSDRIFDDFQTKVKLTYSESNYSDIFSLLMKILHHCEGIYALQKYVEESLLHKNFSHMINLIEKFNDSGDLEEVRQLLNIIGMITGISFSQDDINMFLQAVSDEEQIKYVLGVTTQYMLLTVHGAKGLEADNVIIDPSEFLYGRKFSQQAHYVAITRAKKKLWLMNDNLTYKNLVAERLQKDSTLINLI